MAAEKSTDWGSFLKDTVSTGLGSFFGKKEDKPAAKPATVSKPINWKLIAGIGAGVLVAIVTLGLVFRSPKRSA